MIRRELIVVLILVCSAFVFAESCGTGLTDGMISYWKLDNSGTGPVIDYYDDNNGTNNGATRGVAGKVDNAFSFDGVNDYILVGDSDSLDITNRITLSAWIRTPNYINMYPRIISKKDTYDMYFNTAGYLYLRIGTTFIQSSNIVPKGNWHHIAITFDDTINTINWYVDGTLKETTSGFTADIPSTTQPLVIGNYYGFTRNWNGEIDEVAIWNRTLNSSEVLELYMLGNNSQSYCEFGEERVIPEVNGDNLTKIFILLIVALLFGALLLKKKQSKHLYKIILIF